MKTVETDENKLKQEGGKVGGGAETAERVLDRLCRLLKKCMPWHDNTQHVATNSATYRLNKSRGWYRENLDYDNNFYKQSDKMSPTSQTGLVLKFQGLCLVFYWKYDVLSWIPILSKFEWFLKILGNAGH